MQAWSCHVHDGEVVRIQQLVAVEDLAVDHKAEADATDTQPLEVDDEDLGFAHVDGDAAGAGSEVLIKHLANELHVQVGQQYLP